jgi:hypothetical protein
MRQHVPKSVETGRIRSGPLRSDRTDGFNGAFVIRHRGRDLFVIASLGYGWDHVSVSLKGRCPTFDELKHIKTLFWEDDETVVHYFPKSSEYINNHPFTLHLWRRQSSPHVLPPSVFV